MKVAALCLFALSTATPAFAAQDAEMFKAFSMALGYTLMDYGPNAVGRQIENGTPSTNPVLGCRVVLKNLDEKNVDVAIVTNDPSSDETRTTEFKASVESAQFQVGDKGEILVTSEAGTLHFDLVAGGADLVIREGSLEQSCALRK